MRLFFVFALLTSATILLSSFLRRQLPKPVDLRLELMAHEFPQISPFTAEEKKLAKLGRLLFHDPRLSQDGSKACGTCHQEERYFTAARHSDRQWQRNAPSLVNLFATSWFFWDGRADSWEMLLNEHLHDKQIMAATSLHVARLIFTDYRDAYESIFSTFPQVLIDLLQSENESAILPVLAQAQIQIPAALDELWQQYHLSHEYDEISPASLKAAEQEALQLLMRAVVQALGQYQRGLISRQSAFDRFLQRVAKKGSTRALNSEFSKQELRGFELFVGKAGCVACHNGPLFQDGKFHHTGLARGSRLSLGRAEGLMRWAQHPHACHSAELNSWCAAGQRATLLADSKLLLLSIGQIKTPSLRNVQHTAPYMSDGSYQHLAEVLQAYNDGFVQGLGQPDPKIRPLELSFAELNDLLAFLHSLSSEVEDLSQD